ncbi:hypothetical protein QA601_09700 [Chitinispirillales bacterium ANBcel5]|uniref:hypothetical protein n=1 Tax=Cellulosispirillum alkaliphilum TaxID=3039283 RepID=UPI002A5055D4|nr:hypothetical protein [Chitinispirillales bacterium ANBcel5]
MLVYANHNLICRTETFLEEVKRCADRILDRATEDSIVELLIECGEFESCVCDYYSPNAEHFTRAGGLLRQLTILSAQVYYDYLKNGRSLEKMTQFFPLFKHLKATQLPYYVQRRIPEGYAFYSLYPETFYDASEKIIDELHPKKVVCIGLRSIGTSLSAAVTSVLLANGVDVSSFTVRPFGDTFNRQIKLDNQMIEKFIHWDAYYLIVDEGPGLSGSSFCGTAEYLEKFGIPGERIVFLPSWIPSSKNFVCQKSRERWNNYKKFTGEFDKVWKKIQNNLISAEPTLTDISGGKWRYHLFSRPALWPAVNPYHERRKYLLDTINTGTIVAKFSGLGRYQKETEKIATILSNTYSSPVLKVQNGFVFYRFMDVKEDASSSLCTLFHTVVDYLVFRSKRLLCEQLTSYEQMLEMIEGNISKIGRKDLLKKLKKVLINTELYRRRPIAVDSRMLPHKWIYSENRWVKLDGTDHYRDQFLPAAQDIAWDIAGFCIEFALCNRSTKDFLSIYKEKSGDYELDRVLPFHFIAYTVFRIGYSALAKESLSGTVEAQRFNQKLQFYIRCLETKLEEYNTTY